MFLQSRLGSVSIAMACLLGVWSSLALAAPAPSPTPTPLQTATNSETRRAFVVGIKSYPDRDIQSLQFPDADAKGLASDLEQVGFDKKNIVTAINLRARADFDKQFGAFLATVKEGDVVLFYFSGHGVGLQSSNTDFLLLGGVRSLFSYAHDKLSPIDRGSDEIIRLKMPSLEADYENDEISKNGVSVQDVIAQIAAKKPKVAILMLDACRSLATPNAAREDLVRGKDSGSLMLPADHLPEGAIVIFSAAFGESSIESFPDENPKNSLFTEVVRSELQRPGQTLVEFADRIKLMVRAFANKHGRQQEPQYDQKLGSEVQFHLVDSVGAERFSPKTDPCEGAQEDWDDISRRNDRDALERHQRRFHDCPTAEKARVKLFGISGGDTRLKPQLQTKSSKPIDDCDRLAASDIDTDRPADVPGLPLEKIDYAAAAPACEDAIKRNPRVARFLYDLGRAQFAAATYDDSLSDQQRGAKLKGARATFEDAANRGYVIAMYGLTTLFYDPDESQDDLDRDDKLLLEAAQQQFAPAMYELAKRLQTGTKGKERDINEGYRWLIKAADQGAVQAMVDVSKALFDGSGVAQNPRRAVEWAQRAANADSVEAKLQLGMYYYTGRYVANPQTHEASPNTLARDYTQALLWWGRAAEEGDAAAQYNLAIMMEAGDGLPSPQPEIAERYYRLAAHGGDEDAEYELARRLRSGLLIAKPENGDAEALDLLRRALSHGSARAAETLAEIYRNGELGIEKDPIKALQYAFEAIRLSRLADPTERDGDPYHEMAAGILLAEMAYNNQAVDVNGSPLLKPEELDRLQKYYGKVDPNIRKVEVRSFQVPLLCVDPKLKLPWAYPQQVWVWDWGRNEPPTEPQFRSLERQTGCPYNDKLRQILSITYQTAKKSSVSFPDLIEEQVLAARTRAAGETSRKP